MMFEKSQKGASMTRSIFRGVLALSLLVATAGVFADERKVAGFGKKHGVEQYDVRSHANGVLAYDLLGADEKVIASVKLHSLPNGALRLQSKTAANEPLELLWDLNSGRFELSVGNAKAVKVANREEMRFDASGDVQLFETHKELLERLSASIADFGPSVRQQPAP